MDRAKLAARRQRLRLVDGGEDIDVKGKVAQRVSRAPSNQKVAIRQQKSAGKSKSSRPETTVHNGALLVRQILQRQQYGDLDAFFEATSKQQLIEQLVVLAVYATDLRGEAVETTEAAELVIHQQSTRYQQAACDLVQRDNHIRDLKEKVAEHERSLKRADEEYKSLLQWIQDKEGTWKLTNQARHDQEELIRELSAIQKQREEQLNSISRDLEQSVQFVQELQAENEDVTQRLRVEERESARVDKELELARKKIQTTELELRQKAQELEATSSNLENTKSEVLALRDELKVETVMRQAAIIDREKLQLQLDKETREWRAKQDLWENVEQRITQQLRRLDVETRHLKQTMSRLRVECEGERAQREKTEANALGLARTVDELKNLRSNQDTDLKRLRLELEDAKADMDNKNNALQKAYRGLKMLQKCSNDERAAKEETQQELRSVSQRCDCNEDTIMEYNGTYSLRYNDKSDGGETRLLLLMRQDCVE